MIDDTAGSRSSVAVGELPLTVYTAESALTDPAKLVRAMWHDLFAARELAWRLFVRDISAQYRQSLLGFAWAFLPPVLTGLVFIVLQAKNVIAFAATDIPYPVFVFIGTLYWQIFVDALNAPLKSVSAARPIIARIRFPREALILSAAYWVVFNAAIRGIVLVGVFWYFDVSATMGLLLAPGAVAMLIVLGLAIGLTLTPLGMLYTDVSSGLVAFTQLWFFATPVVYPAPDTYPLSLLATFNPVSPLLTAARDLTATGTLTNAAAFFVTSGLSVAGIFVAWALYRIALPILTERMSA